MDEKNKNLILVVCWGNIFRSPVAEALINRELNIKGLDSEYFCISRGIQGTAGVSQPKHFNLQNYQDVYDKVKVKLEEFDIIREINKKQATPFTKDDLDSSHIIIAMGQDVLYGENTLEKPVNFGLISQFPEISHKIFLIDIDDPYEKEVVCDFAQTVEIIARKVRFFVGRIGSLSDFYVNANGVKEI
jgi:protein-tyrosine-phosphatase